MRQQLSRICGGVLAVAALTLGGCSSATTAATTVSTSATVTQTAPSVWSTGESGQPAEADDSTASGQASAAGSTLPGLSEPCTAAIRAQTAVNELLARSLGTSTSPAASTSADATAPGTSTTGTSSTGTSTGGITTADVEHTFQAIDPTIPASLVDDFDALHQAALKAAAKPAAEIPGILQQKSVTTAMKAIGSYIAGCQPAKAG